MESFFNKLMHVDQRIIYILMAIAVVVPMLFEGFILPVVVTEPVKSVYEEVEKLPEGSRVFVAMDFVPAVDPEMSPMAIAFLKHCFRKKLQVTGMTLEPQGITLAYENMKAASQQVYYEYVINDEGDRFPRRMEVDAREYTNWVFLGAQPGG